MSAGGDDKPQPGRMATALGQSGEKDNVKILAHGHGRDAQQMLALAQEHEIPVIQDFVLSSALRKFPAGTQIPDPVFQGLGVLLDYLIKHEEVLATMNQDSER